MSEEDNEIGNNPIVFFDIELGRQPLGRVKMELFAEDLPQTCENFRQFCTGEYRKNFQPVGYKNSIFHRVISGFMIQGGDFVKGDGRGSMSIFEKDEFEDEGFFYEHKPMMLSMANSGPNTNGCQFFICCADLPHLDGKHVVFGRVIEGEEIIRQIERVTTGENDKPVLDVRIVQCGEY